MMRDRRIMLSARLLFRRHRSLLLVGLLGLLVGCSSPPPPAKQAVAKKPAPMPDVFQVKLETAKGDIVVEVHKDWAPRGAEHFYELVNSGFFDGARFYRVVRNYIAQFGFNGNPKLDALWQISYIQDDPVKQSNLKGYVSFAQEGPRTRSTQVFINLRNNKDLDKSHFAPFGRVVSGMDLVEKLYYSYGDLPPRGYGPDPKLLGSQGNAYLDDKFPRLDAIKKATVLAADQK